MKKLVATLIATGMLVGLGAVTAQSASHGVDIRIPNVLMIQIVDDAGEGVASGGLVEFDYQSDDTRINEYLVAADAELSLPPTAVTDFAGLRVLSNRATWSVYVHASSNGVVGSPPFDYDAQGTGLTGTGMTLADISGGTWTLATATAIFTGLRTTAWQDLSFSGLDYRLAVDGAEDPGIYTTIVTFTIEAP